MISAGSGEKTIAEIVPHLETGDILIDGGNSYYVDDISRAKRLAERGIEYGRIAAYAEGAGVLKVGNIDKHPGEINAETSPYAISNTISTTSTFLTSARSGAEAVSSRPGCSTSRQLR
jgi:6-phosphogluconate dehydrogenase (decarboxylating)